MNKRKLRAVPWETAESEMAAAAKYLHGVRYIVKTTILDDMAVMYFFNVYKLKTGNRNAEFRTFHTHDDYITQTLDKWVTGRFCRMDALNGIHYWLNGYHNWHTFVAIAFWDQKILSDYFGTSFETSKLWDKILGIQEEIRLSRLEARYDEELRETDELMATVSPPPDEFFDWAWNTAMPQYFIYQGRYTAECECMACGNKGKISRKKIHLRHNEKGVCPFCGHPVVFKAKGIMAKMIYDERDLVYIDPVENGFVFRVFYAQRWIPGGTKILEVRRTFFTFSEGRLEYRSFEFYSYKAGAKLRWAPTSDVLRKQRPCWINILYPGNLPDAWPDMKYSALEVLGEHLQQVRNETLIHLYFRFPKLEWMIKMGLFNLVESFSYYAFYASKMMCIDMDGETVYDILKLDKENTRLLQAVNGGSSELKVIQEFNRQGLHPSKEAFEEYYRVFGEDVSIIADHEASIHKICRYIEKEMPTYFGLVRDWKEYVNWCRVLGYDLSDPHIYLPVHFRTAHDRVAHEYEIEMDRIRKEQRAQAKIDIKEIMKVLKQNIGNVGNKNYIVVVPESWDEIHAEGEALHNCLGTYLDKVASRRSAIFFIREADNPDAPFYALEWSCGHIVQCRGVNNCGMTEPVADFVSRIEDKIREACKKTYKKAS